MLLTDLSRPKLVIFDCDGTLVDSEAVSNLAFIDAFADEGLDLDVKKTEQELTGLTLDACLAFMEEKLGRKLSTDFVDDLQKDTFQRLAESVEEIPGATALVRAIQEAGIAVCVASNGEHEKMDITLGRTGLASFFNGYVYSAVDDPIEKGKPAPDLFLYAADRMGVAPADCLVFEDSAPGVDAARSAGMTVIGYRHPADIEIADLTAFIPVVEGW